MKRPRALSLLPDHDPMKERTLDGFGARLAALRQAQGLSQDELAAQVDVSRRVIAYYEADGAQPPGAMLVDLAQALHVSTDALLGLTPVKTPRAPKTARLLKRLQQIEELPPADQRTVLKLVDALVDARRRTAPATRARKPAEHPEKPHRAARRAARAAGSSGS